MAYTYIFTYGQKRARTIEKLPKANYWSYLIYYVPRILISKKTPLTYRERKIEILEVSQDK